MNEVKKKFISNLSTLMREKHISQANLAMALSVDQTTISAWLRGESEPTLGKICMLLEFFDVCFEELID